MQETQSIKSVVQSNGRTRTMESPFSDVVEYVFAFYPNQFSGIGPKTVGEIQQYVETEGNIGGIATNNKLIARTAALAIKAARLEEVGSQLSGSERRLAVIRALRAYRMQHRLKMEEAWL